MFTLIIILEAPMNHRYFIPETTVFIECFPHTRLIDNTGWGSLIGIDRLQLPSIFSVFSTKQYN